MSELGTIKVSGFRMNDQEILVEGTEGKSIKQVAEHLGLDMSGRVWIVNGSRVSESEAAATVVKAGDSVQTATKNDQGERTA